MQSMRNSLLKTNYKNFRSNFNSEVLKNFDWHLFDAIINVVKNDDKEGFDQLLSFICKTLFRFARTGSADVCNIYLNLLLRIYSNIQKNEFFRNNYINEVTLNIRYIITFSNNENQIGFEEITILCISFFTNLLRKQIMFKRIDDYKKTLNRISLIVRHSSLSNLCHKVELSNKEQKDFFIVRHFNISFLIIQSWLVFLHVHNKIDVKKINEFSKPLIFPFIPFDELIKELKYIKQNTSLYNIDDWDYKDRPEGFGYSPPNPHYWILNGFLLLTLRRSDLSAVDIKEIKDDIDFGFMLDSIKKDLIYFEENLDRFKVILFDKAIIDQKSNVELLEVFVERRKRIIFIFNSLKRRYQSKIDKEIAESKLSETLIADYKKTVLERWKSSRNIFDIFEHFENIEYQKSEDDLLFIGKRIFFSKAKIMFIEENYQHILNSDHLGIELKNGVENEFIKKLLLSKNFSSIQYSDPFEAIDREMKNLRDKMITPSLIIMPISYSYKSKPNEKFIPSWLDKQNNKDIFNVGYFDDVPIYGTYNNVFDNYIYIGDFAKTIKMEIYEDESLFDKIMHLKVRELTPEEVVEKLKTDIEQIKYDENGIELTEEESQNVTKNTIVIEIWVKLKFQILSYKHYSLINLNETVQKH